MNRYVPTYQLYGEEIEHEGQFWLHCETIQERSRLHDWEIRPHRHQAFFQMLYISDGTGEVLTGDGYRAFAGDTLIFVPPGIVHGFRFSRDIVGLVVTVPRDRLDIPSGASRHLAAFAAETRMVTGAESTARLAVDSLHRIAAEVAGHGIGRMILAEALVTAALIDLARASGARAEQSPDPDDRDQQRLEQLASLINTHFREHRPAAFYAERIGLSAAHLNRIARSRTGRSLQALIAARLVEEARRSLVFTFLPAQSIAHDLGFSDPAYFSRFFSRHAGVSPAAYRARERARLKF
jgi:AraC family transcriptional regulator, transcriptional activator of pobA